jgi:hypothetical protein
MWCTANFDEAVRQLLAQIGLSVSRFRTEGLAMAAVEQLPIDVRERALLMIREHTLP